MTTTQKPPVSNGVNVQALLDARTALVDAPEAAQFTWRATNEWAGGTHSKSTVEEFFGLGGDQTHKTTFQYSADHPEVFASEDHGPTPVEFVLVGLASCLTAGVAAVAQNREIQLNSVPATLEGDMDILGILGRAGHHSTILIADGNYPAASKRGPHAQVISLNLMPGVVNCTQVLEAILSAVPIEGAITRPTGSS